MDHIYKDGTYLENNPTWHEEDAPFKAEKIRKLLQRNKIKLSQIAEVGCGSGEILVQLQKHLPSDSKYYGFDISPEAIAIARKKESENLRFEETDITLSGEYYFDLLLVIDVIEHIENYMEFLRKLSPLSRYTIFHIPLDMCIWSLLREGMLIESKNKVGHIHNFTEMFILEILNDNGFEIIDKLYTEPLYGKESVKQKIVNRTRDFLFKLSPKFATKTIGGFSVMVLAKNKKK